MALAKLGGPLLLTVCDRDTHQAQASLGQGQQAQHQPMDTSLESDQGCNPTVQSLGTETGLGCRPLSQVTGTSRGLFTDDVWLGRL